MATNSTLGFERCKASREATTYSVVEEARPIPPETSLDSVDFINHGGVVILA
jgi:hypothetical protein